MKNNAYEWDVKTIGELAYKPQYGYTARAVEEKVGPKYLRITDITDGNIRWDNVPYCKCPDEDADKYLLKKNDILFARTGSTGSVILINEIPEPTIFASYLIRLRLRKKVNPRFLNQFFQSWNYWKQIGRLKVGAVQSGINASVLSSIEIPVPPLVEQRGIVEVLGTVDECIHLTDQVIERAEELKRGLMQQFLTRGMGHTEYKETPLGEIPKSWKITTIGKICEVGTGGTPSRKNPDYYKGDIPWVKSTEIKYNIVYDTEEKISKNALKHSNTKYYPPGTLLIAMYGQGITRGKCAILGIYATVNQAIAAINNKNDELHIPFLKNWCEYHYHDIRNYGQGANQPNLNLRLIRQIKILLPPIKEQIEINKILNKTDEELTIENNQKNSLILLKQGLIQLLLSGKTRVELKGDELHRIGDSRETHH